VQTHLNTVIKVNDCSVVFIYSIIVHSCYNQTLHIFGWTKKGFYINIPINGRK